MVGHDVSNNGGFIIGETAKIKTCASLVELNDIFVNSILDSPSLCTAEWFNYHHTLL